ncbi:hypothetical protein [Ruminococcus gauvreauii]|uniref:hypothetical protein n=1 Tax=Ruminococcus gauvreauii TaxID=438033 RepID=UPI0039840FE8
MPFIIGDDRKVEYGSLIRFFEEEQEKYAEMVKDFICPVEQTLKHNRCNKVEEIRE